MLIIGLAGTNGAGKELLVEYLISEENFIHLSMSGFLNEELKRRGIPINRDTQIEIANKLRADYGPDYIISQLFKRVESESRNVVVESIRNPKEAEFVKSHGGILIAVDAEQGIRFERIQGRGSEKDSVTFVEFKMQEEKEFLGLDPNAQNLARCIEMSDYKIDNSGSREELLVRIKETMDNIKKLI